MVEGAWTTVRTCGRQSSQQHSLSELHEAHIEDDPISLPLSLLFSHSVVSNSL